MMRALYTAASGMMAQQINIDNISHNLSNVQSNAYKKSRTEFEDLMYASMDAPGLQADTGIQMGMGTRAVASDRQFSSGSLKNTGNNFDLAIQGDGFFAVKTPDGKTAYTRDGSFKLDAKGTLCTTSGASLGIKIPKDMMDIRVDPDGKVSGVPLTGTQRQTIDQIKLTRFLNPAGMKALGQNLYAWTPNAGEKKEGIPQGPGFGAVTQGYLEQSNVNIVEEMINILQAQRSFEINQKTVQVADDMQKEAIQLKKA